MVIQVPLQSACATMCIRNGERTDCSTRRSCSACSFRSYRLAAYARLYSALIFSARNTVECEPCPTGRKRLQLVGPSGTSGLPVTCCWLHKQTKCGLNLHAPIFLCFFKSDRGLLKGAFLFPVSHSSQIPCFSWPTTHRVCLPERALS